MSKPEPQMESIFSDDFFLFIRASEDMANALAREFSRLPSTLREVEISVDVNSDVRVRQQYRSLRQSLVQGVSNTLDFLNLLKDILLLKEDMERWGWIDKELENAASSVNFRGIITDKKSSCPLLCDFENEVLIRIEGLRKVREKLYAVYQQIQEETGALFVMVSGRSYTDVTLASTDITLSSLWLAKNATVGVLAVGTVVFALGLTGISSFCSQLISGIRIPLTIFFLAFLAFGYRSLYNKCFELEQEHVRRNEAVSTLNGVISTIISHRVTFQAAIQMHFNELQAIRVFGNRFFCQSSSIKEIEAKKAELQYVMNCLQ